MKLDLTVLAIPAFIGGMAAEYAWQRKHPVDPGTRAGDYEFKDTMASLSMGLGSLVAPYVSKALLGPLTKRGQDADDRGDWRHRRDDRPGRRTQGAQ